VFWSVEVHLHFIATVRTRANNKRKAGADKKIIVCSMNSQTAINGTIFISTVLQLGFQKIFHDTRLADIIIAYHLYIMANKCCVNWYHLCHQVYVLMDSKLRASGNLKEGVKKLPVNATEAEQRAREETNRIIYNINRGFHRGVYKFVGDLYKLACKLFKYLDAHNNLDGQVELAMMSDDVYKTLTEFANEPVKREELIALAKKTSPERRSLMLRVNGKNSCYSDIYMYITLTSKLF